MFSVCLKVFCSLFPSVCARCFVYGCTPDMHTHARTYTHTLAGLRSSLGTAPLPSSSQLILASCHVLSTSPLHPTHPPPPHFHLCFQTCFFFLCVRVCSSQSGPQWLIKQAPSPVVITDTRLDRLVIFMLLHKKSVLPLKHLKCPPPPFPF